MIEITPNIVLKPISLDMVSDIYNTIDTEREYLRVWLPFVDNTLDESVIHAFVSSKLETGQIVFTIYDNDKFIGLIGFHNLDNANRKAEIGYWLSEKAQGKGIITQAVKELLMMAFTELNLNSIRILAAVDNLKSRRIPEKLGFTLEGITRDGELLVDNKFTDIAVYSLLKKEFTI
jgi:ribosomal-protein-serine acetyltransferase